ncbi:phospholipid phosphatase 1-like [Montipora foliosa]|uniref:phospholipid phosphatase 1-like n=1 Tax=Montipora foliosa TaxID=591990 RepID=UPI0035F20CB7
MSANSEDDLRPAPEVEILPQNAYKLREIVPSVERKPRFICILVDFLCLAAVEILILIFKFVIPPFKRGFYCDDDTINKPYKESTVPSTVLYSVGFVLAFIVISSTEFYNSRREGMSRMKTKEDSHFNLGPLKLNSRNIEILRLFIGFTYGGLITIFLTDVGKYTVGRLRPHFLSICKAPPAVFTNCSHNYILGDVCTGDPGLLREGRLSFPSGHASFSAYAVTFTILYMEATMSFPHSKFLKFFIQLVVAQLGILCSLSRISDYKHHWSDVLAGMLLGILTAVLILNHVLQMFRRDKSSRKPVPVGTV